MNQDGAASDDFRTRICASQGVFQERSAEALALLSLVHGQAREQNDRNGFWRGPAGAGCGCLP